MTDIQTYKLGEFKTQAGETIPDAFIAYKTFGDPSLPCVVYPTWYSSPISDNEWLISDKHKSLNPKRFFIVITALFGNGESSSPSNTAGMPKTTVADNVKAQHQLITEELKINKVKMVLGWSMGAGQTFQWGASYPDMVEYLVPFCGAARTALHNITFLRSLAMTLKVDPLYQDGKYDPVTEQPQNGKKAFAAIYSGWGFSQAFYRQHLYKKIGYESFQDFLDIWWTNVFINKDANNLLHLLDTWITADITCTPGKTYSHDPAAGRSPDDKYVAALESIKAKTMIMPCRTDLYFPPEDSQFEAEHIPNATLNVIESVWGHFAGGPGVNPEDVTYLDDSIDAFLSGKKVG